jgi:hypothetical protein
MCYTCCYILPVIFLYFLLFQGCSLRRSSVGLQILYLGAWYKFLRRAGYGELYGNEWDIEFRMRKVVQDRLARVGEPEVHIQFISALL